jgi:predicted DNA-binding antitoxin AbrB/MazE fold protein
MADDANLPARYFKGTLKLCRPLQLPDGTQVRVTITIAGSKPRARRTARRKCTDPTGLRS